MSHSDVFVLLKRDFGEHYNQSVVAAMMQPYEYRIPAVEICLELYPDTCYCQSYPNCDDCDEKRYREFYCDVCDEQAGCDSPKDPELHDPEKCKKSQSGYDWRVGNYLAKWDDYEIVGKLPEGVQLVPYTQEELQENQAYYPDVVIDTNGIWHEEGLGKERKTNWEEIVDDLLAKHKSIVMEVDCHC